MEIKHTATAPRKMVGAIDSVLDTIIVPNAINNKSKNWFSFSEQGISLFSPEGEESLESLVQANELLTPIYEGDTVTLKIQF